MNDNDPGTRVPAMAASTTTIEDLKLALSHVNHQIHAIYSGQNPAAIHLYESLQTTASTLHKDIEIEELKFKLVVAQSYFRGKEELLYTTRMELRDTQASLHDTQRRILKVEVQLLEVKGQNAELKQRVDVRGKTTEKAQQMCLEFMLENEELKEELEKLRKKAGEETRIGNDEEFQSKESYIKGLSEELDALRQEVEASRNSTLRTTQNSSKDMVSLNDQAWTRNIRVRAHVAAEVAEAERAMISHQAKDMFDFEDPRWKTNPRVVAYLKEQLTQTTNKNTDVPQSTETPNLHNPQLTDPNIQDWVVKTPDPNNSQDTSQPNPQNHTETIFLQGRTYHCHPLIKEYVDFADTTVNDLLVFQSQNMLNFMDPAWIRDHRICSYVAQRLSETHEAMMISIFKDTAWKNNPQVSAYIREQVSEERKEIIHQRHNMSFQNPRWTQHKRSKSHVSEMMVEAKREVLISQHKLVVDSRQKNWVTDERIVALVAERIAEAKSFMTTDEALSLVDFEGHAWKEHPKVFAYVLEQIADAEKQMTTSEVLDLVDFDDDAWSKHPQVIDYFNGLINNVLEGTAESDLSVSQLPGLVNSNNHEAWKKNPKVVEYVQYKVDRAKEHLTSYQRLNMVDFTHPTWKSHPTILAHVAEQTRQAEGSMRSYQFLNMVDFKNPIWMKDRRIANHVREAIAKAKAAEQ